jgi:DNA invertase Pin-like site-specific DNA recombinase
MSATISPKEGAMPKRAGKPKKVDDGRPKLVGLVRVSTGRQEVSGLGLEGQLAALEQYRGSVDGEFLRTYTEVESGTHDDIGSRPQLKTAVAHALFARATLVIAKLDRLVRSIPVMGYLETNRVKFVVCDNPHANKLTKDILVVVASAEAVMISNRTRDALKAYRDAEPPRVSKRTREFYRLRGEDVPPEVIEATAGKLGGSLPQCRNLTPERTRLGVAAASAARTRKAAVAYSHLTPVMLEMRAGGASLQAIADRLNDEGHQTRNGCDWNAGQVKRVLDRIKTD